AQLEHQLRIVVATGIEPTHDRASVPVETLTVEHHDAELAAGVEPARVLPGRRRVRLVRAEHPRVAERQSRELGDVVEHEHVGVEVHRAPGVAAELWNREASEGERRAASVLPLALTRDLHTGERRHVYRHGAPG